MHPLNLLSPPLPMTFQVTNNGLPASALALSSPLDLFPSEKKLLRLLLLLVAELDSLTPLGEELVLCTLDELALPGEGARRRDIAAGRYGESFAVVAGAAFSSISSESEGSRTSGTLGSALNLFHRSSTSRRLSGGRFSRLAERDSKQ